MGMHRPTNPRLTLCACLACVQLETKHTLSWCNLQNCKRHGYSGVPSGHADTHSDWPSVLWNSVGILFKTNLHSCTRDGDLFPKLITCYCTSNACVPLPCMNSWGYLLTRHKHLPNPQTTCHRVGYLSLKLMHICENHFHISATNEVPEDTPVALEDESHTLKDKSHTLEDPQAKLHSVLVSTDPVLFARSLLLLRKKLSDFGPDALQMYVRNDAPKVGIIYDMN